EAGDARGKMDHVAAAEVDRAVMREVAAAPDEERVDRVHARSPQDYERDPRLEVHAAEDGAEHEDRRDPGEDELEVDEGGLREVRLPDEGDVPLALQRLVVEHVPGLADEVPEEARVRQAVPRIAEAHLVPVEHPLDEHEGERDEGEHHRVHRPALLHHAAVQDDETGDAHQPDERRCRELPGVVARIQPLRVQHRPLPSRWSNKKAPGLDGVLRRHCLRGASLPTAWAGRYTALRLDRWEKPANLDDRRTYSCPMEIVGREARAAREALVHLTDARVEAGLDRVVELLSEQAEGILAA